MIQALAAVSGGTKLDRLLFEEHVLSYFRHANCQQDLTFKSEIFKRMNEINFEQIELTGENAIKSDYIFEGDKKAY